jgi:hypothetical protein
MGRSSGGPRSLPRVSRRVGGARDGRVQRGVRQDLVEEAGEDPCRRRGRGGGLPGSGPFRRWPARRGEGDPGAGPPRSARLPRPPPGGAGRRLRDPPPPGGPRAGPPPGGPGADEGPARGPPSSGAGPGARPRARRSLPGAPGPGPPPRPPLPPRSIRRFEERRRASTATAAPVEPAAERRAARRSSGSPAGRRSTVRSTSASGSRAVGGVELGVEEAQDPGGGVEGEGRRGKARPVRTLSSSSRTRSGDSRPRWGTPAQTAPRWRPPPGGGTGRRSGGREGPGGSPRRSALPARPTVRRSRASRSAAPPKGSWKAPVRGCQATALIVKSRRARSSSSESAKATTACRPVVSTSRRKVVTS